MDQRAQHFRLRLQFDQRKLDALVAGQRLAERRALERILHRLIDAVLRRAQRGRRLADAVLVEEVLHHLQRLALAAEDSNCAGTCTLVNDTRP